MRLLLLTLLGSTILFAQGGGGVQFRDLALHFTSQRPTTGCSDLRSQTNYELSVISARLIPAAADAPEHCRVNIMVQPEVNIQVNLPTAWNGRLYMFGNGGWAGESFESPGRVLNRARGLKAGFVTAATDTGHSAAAEPGGSFALNRQKLLDYAFRSQHLTADAAKRMALAYYGSGPAKSYYEGCSQGGRQGLILAQRFPADFDGIIVGAPALNMTGTHLSRAYWMKGMNTNPLPASKLPLLARKVYDKCDAVDGLKDGLIDDPRRCDFKPARDLPHCSSSADQSDCFTPDQIAAIERIYGDVVSNGKRMFPGWPLGAEVEGPNGQSGWLGQEVNGPKGFGAWTSYGANFLRFVAPGAKNDGSPVDPPTLFAQFDIDRDPPRMEEIRQIWDATDPDLSAFRRRGGKMLMYFGWSDPQLNPRMGVEYYEQVVETMGATTDQFFRLFMIPGMFHCGGGVGTSQFDAASPVVKWVENGTAPEHVEAARVVSGKVVRTRPLCAYPQVARYKGTGSIDDTANFTCAKP